jgi:DNA-binding SARP family transcriptional activator
MLALNVNRVTPVELLIDAVWDDDPPSTARGQIQICISALRKLFGQVRPDVIKTRSPGYVLELAEDELDSTRFASAVAAAKSHVESGRIAEAAGAFGEALELWRGPALAGVPGDLVQRHAALLDGHRLTALEERLRLDLELGRSQQIVAELRALCEEYPLREQFHGFLMLALYRSHRQAEALEVCRRVRANLIENVGVEPSSELRKLEQAILNQAPELDLRAQSAPAVIAPTVEPAPAAEPAEAEVRDVPRQLPASIADFTGRKAQIEEIRRLLTETGDQYSMPIVTIYGRGGVGKSTLAIRVAHELGDHFPDGHLYADLQAHHEDDYVSQVLGRFLRALGVNGSSIPDSLSERAEMYRSRLAGKRVLVILDDVVSEDEVAPLLPGSPTCAVIATSRSRLSGLPGGYGLHIAEFEVDQSLALLAKITGALRVETEAEEAIKLVDLCDGLPLAVRIAGARLASRPHLRIEGLLRRLGNEARRLDELTHRGLALRPTLNVTYRGLDQKAKRLFRLFALMRGSDFPGWTAAALLDTDLSEAEAVLERLMDVQVLDTVEQPDVPLTRYRFHDLVRVYAHEQLMDTETEEERRAALGRVLGCWLALSEQAHRKEYGGDFTILHGSAPRWYPPGPASDTIDYPDTWWASERSSLVAAIKQAAEAGFDELCWDLAFASVSLFEAGCHFDDWRETVQLGLQVTMDASNSRGVGAMLYSAGSLDMVQQKLNSARHNFEQALELFEAESDHHGRALVLRNLAYVRGVLGDDLAMRADYAQSLTLMRQVGDRIGEAHVLRAMAKHSIDDGDTVSARDSLEQALHICREVGSRRCEAQVLHRFAELHLRTDEIELARQALHQVLLTVRDKGDKIGEVYTLYSLGIVRFREGRLDHAVTTLGHTLELATQMGERLVEGQARYMLGEVSIARGNPVAGRTHLADALAIFTELDTAPWRVKTLTLLSDIESTLGSLEPARRELGNTITPQLVEVDPHR